MKRFFRLAALLLALTLTLLLAACGGGEEKAADIDPDQLAQSIMEQVSFKDSLARVEGDLAKEWYFLDDKVTDHAIYIDGTGASAQEIAVLKAADAADAAHLEQIMQDRLETLAFYFENYVPAEMQKINNPVIVTKGNVVVMVLHDDVAAAESALDSLLK